MSVFQSRRHKRGSILALLLNALAESQAPPTGAIAVPMSSCSQKALKAAWTPLKASSRASRARLLARSTAKMASDAQMMTVEYMTYIIDIHKPSDPSTWVSGHSDTNFVAAMAAVNRAIPANLLPLDHAYKVTIQNTKAAAGRT